MGDSVASMRRDCLRRIGRRSCMRCWRCEGVVIIKMMDFNA